MTTEEILTRILPDRPFFRDRGGVTLTGGEPMAQPEFVRSLSSLLCRNGIHVVMETCGCAPWEHYADILPFVNRFLFDWKLTDPEQHRNWTGADNRLIRENLGRLHDCGAEIVLRCPVIPGVNDRPEHFRGIARLTEELPRILRVDLLPYHAFGNDKRGQLGLPRDGFSVPEKETVQCWAEELGNLCSVPVR